MKPKTALPPITWRNIIFSYTLIVGAALIECLGVILFLAPADIAPGGVSGVAVMLNHLDARIPIGLVILLGNIPIQMLGAQYLGGWRVVVRTVVYIVLYSALVQIIPNLLPVVEVGDNRLTNSLFGGILVGLSGGLVLRAGGTQGGTATLGRILQYRFGFPLSTTAIYTDSAVVLLAGAIFGWEGALYAIVSLFVGGIASDYMLEGPSVIRTATVITDHPEEVSDLVIRAMGRGVTAWSGTGMYSKEEHTVLFITVSRAQISELRRLVEVADPDAFMVVGQGHVAYGLGFRSIERSF